MSATLQDYLAFRQAAIAAPPGAPGLALCHALSDALDTALASALPEEQGGVALVALGGYGRRELCLFSDVDLMLLYRGALQQGLIERVFYPLWDAGLKVGHAARTVAECVTAATQNVETLTALLDHRFLAGDRGLADALALALQRLLGRSSAQLARTLVQAEQALRAAEPYQLLEANLKQGRGGLRSLQRLRWLARAVPAATLELEPSVDAALDTLLASRNALHAAAGRAQDAWLFDLQPGACRWLGADRDAWSTRLYLAMREVDRHSGAVEHATAPERQPRRLALPGRRRERTAGAPVAPTGSVFAAAVAQATGGLDATFAAMVAAAPGPRWDEADRRGLIALLGMGERGRLLFEALDRLGWLERALPEWRHVRAAPQHAPIHRHPVDVHLWRTAIEALALAEGRTDEPWCAEVATDLGSLDELLLSALLHDIGKGWPGDHAESGAAAAAAFCRRAGFEPGFTLTVTGAVRHHLLLPTVATRRDIADARVIEEVASAAGRLRTLQVLYLLSVADSRATGPAVWSPWKASLMRSLFAQAAARLEAWSGATPLTPPQADARERVLQAAAGGGLDERMVAAHIDGMDPGYLQSFPAGEVLRHVRVMTPPPGPLGVRLDVRDDGIVHDLVLVTRDRPGLIALVSGVLALHNLSVLGGRFFTRADGIALQSLQTVDALGNEVDARRWERIEADVERALSGALPLEQRLTEKRHAYRRLQRGVGADEVRFASAASGRYTVLEVQAADRIGLLHAITQALFALGLDVHLAKVDTVGRDVVDTFYVREADGRPLPPGERLQQVRAAVLQALGSPGAPGARV